MRDKIAEIIADIFLGEPKAYSIKAADSILALFPSLEGIVVEEECKNCNGNGHFIDSTEGGIDVICGVCPLKDPKQFDLGGTGVITRPAEWVDFDLFRMINILHPMSETQYIKDNIHFHKGLNLVLTSKSGGRLRVK